MGSREQGKWDCMLGVFVPTAGTHCFRHVEEVLLRGAKPLRQLTAGHSLKLSTHSAVTVQAPKGR